MQNYPIFVDLQQQPCLMVGGGQIALRKIRLLHSAGAKITVIAPELCDAIKQEFGESITHIKREFKDHDISGYRLITAATNERSVNARVSELDRRLHMEKSCFCHVSTCRGL